MRYVSNDGIPFDTEAECLEYENRLKKQIEEEQRKLAEKQKKEKEKKEKQKKRYANIIKNHEDLMKEIKNYEKDYNTKVFGGFYTDGMANILFELFK